MTTTQRGRSQAVEHLSDAERAARGKAARKKVPRASLAAWDPPANRPGPVELLRAQEVDRVPELVPIRHERMLVSPFAFYRGAAVIMASDLAIGPRSGLQVQCCGDAHLVNFGGFAAPDRQMVFDVNDFDETSKGPFEWDVKRLVASFEIARRAHGFEDGAESFAEHAARAYREAMTEFASMRNLDVWYSRLDAQAVIDRWAARVSEKDMKRFERTVAKARSKDSMRAFDRLTERVGDEIRIVSDPPLVSRLDDLAEAEVPDAVNVAAITEWVHEQFRGYRASLQPDRRHLLEGYELVDIARKVVGVGSVGTRCWIVLMLGKDDADPLFLQVKEAELSVLEAHAGKSRYRNHGQRVVEGQRLLQAASDILLGWFRTPTPDGLSPRLLRAAALGRQALARHRQHDARSHWRSSPRCAAGPLHGVTRAPETGSRSRRISARGASSTGRWASSRRPTPTRTTATTRRWSQRSAAERRRLRPHDLTALRSSDRSAEEVGMVMGEARADDSSGPPTEKARATRAALIRSAGEYFVDEGYGGVSVRDLARRMQLTSGAIYGHFRSKADLLVAAIRERIESDLEAPYAGRSLGLVDHLTAQARAYRCRAGMRALLVEGAAAARVDPDVRRQLREAHSAKLAEWRSIYHGAAGRRRDRRRRRRRRHARPRLGRRARARRARSARRRPAEAGSVGADHAPGDAVVHRVRGGGMIVDVDSHWEAIDYSPRRAPARAVARRAARRRSSCSRSASPATCSRALPAQTIGRPATELLPDLVARAPRNAAGR